MIAQAKKAVRKRRIAGPKKQRIAGIHDQQCEASASVRADELKDQFDRLLQLDISFIDNADFRLRSASRKILGEAIDLEFVPEIFSQGAMKLPTHLARLCDSPLLTNEEEQAFFRRMNYLLFRASMLRDRLPAKRPNALKMQEVEQLLNEANRVKNRIVAANIRLVISIVKQLTSTPSAFDEMLSDGLLAMIRAVEKFDFDRGFRFSTYATMVIRRQLYRSMKNDHRDKTRYPNGEASLLAEHPENEIEPRIGYNGWIQLNESLQKMIAQLDDREQLIIRARFGFDTDGKKQTLQSLAKEFGVCKERVRQLEKRAMTKLRSFADGFDLEPLVEPEFESC